MLGVPMISNTKDRIGRALRMNPQAMELLQEIAPLPGLDDLRVVIEPAPGTWLTVLKVAISMSAAAVLALWVGASAVTSNFDTAREGHTLTGGGGNGLMAAGGNGLTGVTYPPTLIPPSSGGSAPRAPAPGSAGTGSLR
jgi:hypothetical protein